MIPLKRSEVRKARGLTLWQPMAGAVSSMGKDVENRPRRPPEALVGGILFIHAGKTFHKPHFEWMLEKRLAVADDMTSQDLHVQGAIVAVCRLVEVVEWSPSKWWMGPYGLVLDEVHRLWAPVPCKGQLGYWKIPDDVMKAVMEQVL